MLFLTLPFLNLLACESGTAEVLNVMVAESASTAWTTESPGVIAGDLDGTMSVLAPACGDIVSPFQYVRDFGFGCLGSDVEGTKMRASAWIEPIPAEWDATELCSPTAPQGSPYDGLDITALVPEGASLLAEDWLAGPDNAEFIGAGTGTWKSDFSPCGGNAIANIVIR